MKESIAKWLFGKKWDEIEKAIVLYKDVQHALDGLREYSTKNINVENVVFFGGVHDSKILVEPKLSPRLVLSEINYRGAVYMDGKQQMVMNNVFSIKPSKDEV